jgi:hypothetical protein
MATETIERTYVGEREMGHPVMLVIEEDGSEHSFAPSLGEFDWGWPSLRATRRLARALLLDVTGHEPPEVLCDELAAELLAHLPWGSFSLTARDVRGWLELRRPTSPPV